MDESIRPRKPTDPPPPPQGAGPRIDAALHRLVLAMTGLDQAMNHAAKVTPQAIPDAEEAARIAIDMAYHRAKTTGALQRAEADRALAMQIDRQSAAHFTSTGLWA